MTTCQASDGIGVGEEGDSAMVDATFPTGPTRGARMVGAALAMVILAAVTACDFSGMAPQSELLAAAIVPTGVISPDQVQLRHGRNTQIHNGIIVDTTLLPHRAHSDLDGDGLRDTAALVQTQARLAVPGPASPVTFVSAVIFRNTDRSRGGIAPRVSTALPLGPGAQVHDVDILPAELGRGSPLRSSPARLVVDYALPDTVPAAQPHRQRLTAKLVGNRLERTGSAVAAEIEPSAIPKPIRLTLVPGVGVKGERRARSAPSQQSAVGSATQDGLVGYGATQHYELTVQAGHRVALEVTSDSPVEMTLRDADGIVLVPSGSGERSFHGTAPTSGTYRLDVFSGHTRPARYALAAVVAEPRPVNTTVPGRATSGKVLHLTFDDGPHPRFTGEILEVLARHDVKATFFMVGENAAARPGWIDNALADGHVVAHHGYSHRKLTDVSQQTFDEEIDRTQEAIGVRAAPCLRPPYGAVDEQLRQRAANRGLDTVLWDVDTQDWRRGSPEEIAQRIVVGASSGSIILLHDGGGDRSNTVQALEIALPKLVEQGWSFAPICR